MGQSLSGMVSQGILFFFLIERMMKWVALKKENDSLHPQEKAALMELVRHHDGAAHHLYDAHMPDFLCDTEHYCGMLREGFVHRAGLLLPSEDDNTFTPPISRT